MTPNAIDADDIKVYTCKNIRDDHIKNIRDTHTHRNLSSIVTPKKHDTKKNQSNCVIS
jgi:hypothetical protein